MKPFRKFKIMKISILTEIGDFGEIGGPYLRKVKIRTGVKRANKVTHLPLLSLIPISILIKVDRRGPSTPFKNYSSFSPNPSLVWHHQLTCKCDLSCKNFRNP